MDGNARKPLKLVKNFARIAGSDDVDKQYGYQKIDDTTVLERKELPICAYGDTEDVPSAVIISVYDFKNFEVMTYVQQVYFADNEGTVQRPHFALRPFSELEGKQGIIDAHEALTLLKGNPPPLDEITGLEPKRVSRLDKVAFPGPASK